MTGMTGYGTSRNSNYSYKGCISCKFDIKIYKIKDLLIFTDWEVET